MFIQVNPGFIFSSSGIHLALLNLSASRQPRILSLVVVTVVYQFVRYWKLTTLNLGTTTTLVVWRRTWNGPVGDLIHRRYPDCRGQCDNAHLASP